MRFARATCREAAVSIATLEQRCFDHPWSLSWMESACLSPAYWVMQGQQEGMLKAYLVAQVLGGEIDIHKLGVAPEARRQGWGQALLRQLCDHFAPHGGFSDETPLYLETSVDNTTALSFYTAMGFWAIGTRPHYYPCGAAARRLKQRLGPLREHLALRSRQLSKSGLLAIGPHSHPEM